MVVEDFLLIKGLCFVEGGLVGIFGIFDLVGWLAGWHKVCSFFLYGEDKTSIDLNELGRGTEMGV